MLKQPEQTNYDIGLLLKAAEYIETQDKRDREAEHGYAAPAYHYGEEPLHNKMKTIRRSQNRTSHNELEKNRRAHLRSCLENLKSIVPLSQDSTRHTTLGLLNQACQLIKKLEKSDLQQRLEKARLKKNQDQLKQALLKLQISRHRRNSTGSAWSSSHSESSNDSDKDEEIIDVTDCSEEVEMLRPPNPLTRSNNLITISVPKALSLASRSLSANNNVVKPSKNAHL